MTVDPAGTSNMRQPPSSSGRIVVDRRELVTVNCAARDGLVLPTLLSSFCTASCGTGAASDWTVSVVLELKLLSSISLAAARLSCDQKVRRQHQSVDYDHNGLLALAGHPFYKRASGVLAALSERPGPLPHPHFNALLLSMNGFKASRWIW